MRLWLVHPAGEIYQMAGAAALASILDHEIKLDALDSRSALRENISDVL